MSTREQWIRWCRYMCRHYGYLGPLMFMGGSFFLVAHASGPLWTARYGRVSNDNGASSIKVGGW